MARGASGNNSVNFKGVDIFAVKGIVDLMAVKDQEITGLIQRKRLVRIYVRWEFLVKNAGIMNGSFCGVTS